MTKFVVLYHMDAEAAKQAQSTTPEKQAEGIARIVRTVATCNNVKEGDVMVAITTHPDFVPAMHRAAVVTDEGGLTSHAAIVSRECGIPCLVGTKRVTTAFKEGDLVLVDAETGFVKKVG